MAEQIDIPSLKELADEIPLGSKSDRQINAILATFSEKSQEIQEVLNNFSQEDGQAMSELEFLCLFAALLLLFGAFLDYKKVETNQKHFVTVLVILTLIASTYYQQNIWYLALSIPWVVGLYSQQGILNLPDPDDEG